MTEPDNQRALISAAQTGCVRAFELLMTSHTTRVRRFARAFASTEADADDLAQDALLKVYRHLGAYRFQSAFSTWLYTLVRNLFIDAARSGNGRARSLEESLTDEHAARPALLPSADEQLAAGEERRRLWSAIRALPEEYRSTLVLFDIDGFSYEEVADLQGVALGTVKSRLSRARQLLRVMLERSRPRARRRGVEVLRQPPVASTRALGCFREVSRF